MFNIKRISRVNPVLISIVAVIAELSCAGTGTKKEEVPLAELDCSGEIPVRIHYDKKTGEIKEKGRISIGKMACEKAASLPENRILSFRRNGEWESYHKESTNVQMRGNYEDNRRQGEWLLFDKKGDLKQRVTFKDNQKEGQGIVYFQGTDEWNERGTYSTNLKNGTWEIRGSKDAECISRGEFKDDKKTGLWNECAQSENGDWYLSFSGSYKSGLRNGPSVSYYPGEKIKAKGSYVADLACLNDPPPEGEQSCGRKTGIWKSYHDNGNLMATGSYNGKTGLRSGKWTEYYRNGSRMAEGLRNHVRDGTWKIWNKSGQLLYVMNFNTNEYTPEKITIYTNGKKSAEGPVQMGLLKYDTGDDSINMKSLLQKGKWIHYNSAGSRVAEGEYMMGRKNGQWKELENGKWITRNYQMGRERNR